MLIYLQVRGEGEDARLILHAYPGCAESEGVEYIEAQAYGVDVRRLPAKCLCQTCSKLLDPIWWAQVT